MNKIICPSCKNETKLRFHYFGICEWCGYEINIFKENGRKGGKAKGFKPSKEHIKKMQDGRRKRNEEGNKNQKTNNKE